ncbi:hypothetical protein XU18_1051 [Perkinsela sp. CCAP 1560/4]|nr:hypothetical protein XU18_1051 [Perkinsela sp. CCAP 1560/4]|eukprot:KNH08482.1 hypothetical protein XU18_1051 [Perkinsela sp. CCAP 1560/4]
MCSMNSEASGQSTYTQFDVRSNNLPSKTFSLVNTNENSFEKPRIAKYSAKKVSSVLFMNSPTPHLFFRLKQTWGERMPHERRASASSDFICFLKIASLKNLKLHGFTDIQKSLHGDF